MFPLLLSFLVLQSEIMLGQYPSSKDCPGNESSAVLFFANGMFNDKGDAEESLAALISKTEGRFSSNDIAYNFNETPLLQILQVFWQKRRSDQRFRWSYFSQMDGPPEVKASIQEKVKEMTKEFYVRDADLRNHVALYKRYLKAKKSIVIVAHSQGNFYANGAFEYLQDEQNEQTPDNEFLNAKDLRLKIVGVASPDSYVAGNGSYRTLKSDGVIAKIPNALPPNISNQKFGHFDHLFIEHYLNGDTSGPEILKLIFEASESVSSKSGFFPAGYLHKSLVPMNQWVEKWIQGNGEGDSRSPLSRSQCLSIQLFFYLGDWFGEKCENRSLATLRRESKKCFDREWSDPKQDLFNCNLVGLDWLIVGMNSPTEALKYLDDNPECQWDGNSIHRELKKELLERALNFIKGPIE